MAGVFGLSRWLGNVWAERLKEELRRDFESWRWGLAREDAQAESLRLAVRDIVLPMMSALHAMCWLTWHVRMAPDEIGPADLQQYDKQMHSLLPLVSGHLALVAAHDRKVFEELEELVRKIYLLDAQIGEVGGQLVRSSPVNLDRSALVERLRTLHQQAGGLEKTIPRQIGDLLARTIDRRSERVLADARES